MNCSVVILSSVRAFAWRREKLNLAEAALQLQFRSITILHTYVCVCVVGQAMTRDLQAHKYLAIHSHVSHSFFFFWAILAFTLHFTFRAANKRIFSFLSHPMNRDIREALCRANKGNSSNDAVIVHRILSQRSSECCIRGRLIMFSQSDEADAVIYPMILFLN